MLLLAFSLLFGLTCASQEFHLDGFVVRVVGNDTALVYEFYLEEAPTEVYTFYFPEMFEAVNQLKVVSLPYPSYWEITSREGKEGLEFNITTQGDGNSSKSPCPEGFCIKQTIWIEDYQWQSPDARANLVLLFWLSGGAERNLAGPAGHNKVSYLDAWYSVVDTAHVLDAKGKEINDILVDLFADPSGIWLSYAHFQGSLLHDPVLSMGSIETSTSLVIGLIATFLVVFGIVGVAMYYTQKRREYEIIEG